ncbi:ABC transporter permease [Streptomyces viridochromogenes]|uniref:ABC transporter permease n=1 Tax=Streptomyces viridochromogenes TaxID=1938 RepID=A0A0J7ZD97_STRVR|nr:sugar ABC transporter permease [Streptomyces viridochromogenes]KMS73377.1 ABC transporter permease [Streptomyces viridochromogenes]KOG24359.1 ABC transporter permease [Streptomyces viridochromogenes]KOG25464.1 ABC transporter permease [Streptomyces viridochromogenes]
MATDTPGAEFARPGAGSTAQRAAGRRHTRSAVLFLAPFGLLFTAMLLAPICYAVYQSFFRTNRSGLGLGPSTTVFAGLDNYVTALHDSRFMSSFLRVFTLGIVQVPVMLGMALLLALLLDSRAAVFKKAFRQIYFMPYALPGVIAAIMWSFLYAPSVSPFTAVLRHVGLEVNFLSDHLVLASIGNMMTWAWTGFNMLIIYSALQAIPGELTEAAVMDGCSGWRVAWHVKIPAVRPALILTTVFSIIGTAQLFNEPAVLSQVAPTVSPTYTPILATQQSADVNNYNYAATQSVILALLTFVLSFGFLKFTQRKGTFA